MKFRARTSALMAVAASLALDASGCAWLEQPREFGRCAVGGAAIGALVGTGVGYAIGNSDDGPNGSDTRTIAGAIAGAGIGAVAGGIVGHFVCDPAPPPPPPPPPAPPPPMMPPPPPPPPPVKEKMVLRGVHFDFNKSNIRPGDAAVLDDVVATLKANPNLTIDVNGYCDAIGNVDYNLRLSDRRSNSVVDYLVKAGIPESRLVPHGYGKTDFVATNDTAEGRAQNRRVELVPEQ